MIALTYLITLHIHDMVQDIVMSKAEMLKLTANAFGLDGVSNLLLKKCAQDLNPAILKNVSMKYFT